MPVYTIKGKKVTTDRALSDDEIDEIASSIKGGAVAPASEAKPVGTAAATEDPGFMSQLMSNLLGSGAALPMAQAATGFSELALGRPVPELSMTPADIAASREKITKQLEIQDPYAAKKLAAAAVSGAVDPLNAVFPMGGPVRSALQGGVSALGGYLGATAGETAAGTPGALAGGLAGGLLGSSGFNTFTGTIPKLAGKAYDALTSGKQAVKDISQAAGSAKAAAAATTAFATNPALADELKRAAEIKRLTGVELPVLAASGGDTTLRTLAMSQAGKADNASFTASMGTQYKTASSLLDQAKEEAALGAKTIEQAFSDRVKEQRLLQDKAAANLLVSQKKRVLGLNAINERIAELSSDFSTEAGKTDIGTRLTNLLDSKEAAIRSELSPQYTKLLDTSQKAGVVLPAAETQKLFEFAKDEKNADIFSKFPELYGAIKNVFAPSVRPVSGKFAEKYPQLIKQAEGAEFKDMPLDKLDSLKRNTNKAISKSNDADQLRILGALKREIDGAVDQMDPAFAVPYKALDREYATRLGIPFNEAGVSQIDKAKFVENTIPAITNNASSLKQVIAVTGDSKETFDIVKDAFLYKIGNDKSIVNTATGEVNTAQLNRFLTKNKESIDLVPGLKDYLQKNATKIDTLVENRTRLLDAQKNAKVEKAQDLYSKSAATTDSFYGVVRNALGNPDKLDELLAATKGDVVAKEGVKIAMLDNLMSMPGDRLAFFRDNQPTFEKMFGAGYVPKLEALADASQRLRDNPFNPKVNVKSITKTGFEETTGTAPAQVASLYRNHIQSLFFKVSTLSSRFFQNRLGKSEAADIQAFLLDPQAMNKAAEAMNEISSKGITDNVLKIAKDLAKNTAFSTAFGGLHGLQQSLNLPEKPTKEVDKNLLPSW